MQAQMVFFDDAGNRIGQTALAKALPNQETGQTERQDKNGNPFLFFKFSDKVLGRGGISWYVPLSDAKRDEVKRERTVQDAVNALGMFDETGKPTIPVENVRGVLRMAKNPTIKGLASLDLGTIFRTLDSLAKAE